MIKSDFADLLVDIGIGNLWVGDTEEGIIFIDEMPEKKSDGTPIDEGIVVVDSGDGEVHKYTGVQSHGLDIYSYSRSTANAFDRLESIKLHLHRREGVEGSDTYMYSILAMGANMTLGKDYAGRAVYKQTFDVLFRDADWIS